MSNNGGPPQAGYNPYAVGAQPGGQPDPSARLLGVLNDANVGTGLALNNLGPGKGNVPISIFQDKGTGFKDKIQSGLGIRTRVKFTSELFNLMEGVDTSSNSSEGGTGGSSGNATYEQVYGAAQTIYQNGAVHMGFTPEGMLGGIESPSTPGFSQSKEKGRGGGFGIE
ncbi:MAG: hypothetical protein MK052_11515 [Alphaproteobacteria bacterium]|nr:hypothetical protein [Alphaproteobacteria bacterium]